MKLKTILTGMGMALMMAVSVNAATIESADGVLSIETPSEAWVVTADPQPAPVKIWSSVNTAVSGSRLAMTTGTMSWLHTPATKVRQKAVH